MFRYLKNDIGIKEKVELENTQRELERTKSIVDYIAMMTDVELLEDEQTEETEHEQEV